MMRCRKCGASAVINMRQHKLSLCENCYPRWLEERIQRTIEKYKMFGPQDTILVAVSGGKDSLSLWEILMRLGYRTEAVYINLGIDRNGYSAASQQRIEAFAAQHDDAVYHVVNVREEYGRSIPELGRIRRGRKACALCGLVKRHVMNRMAYQGGYAAITTGHNLDDEAAVLLQNTLHWQVGYLARQAPVLPCTHPKLARKVKPLCRMYEREMAAYALVRGIDYIYDECPYATGATTLFYKELLNQLESRSTGAKQQFYLSFLQARREHGIFGEQAAAVELGECEHCGQPTTAPGRCAFCRLWEN